VTDHQAAAAARVQASRRDSESVAGPYQVGAPETPGQRRARERQRIARVVHGEPLQRRLLSALYRNPATPTELAGELGAKGPSITRRLAEMADAGLVVWDGVEGDGRRHRYRLTPQGASRLAEHRAFGEPDPKPSPLTPEADLGFLREALHGATALRRQNNRLADAAERLTAIRDEAERRGAYQLALDATAALTTTRSEQREQAELAALLVDLEQVALGRHPSGEATLALPAAAYREHALGRMPDTHDEGDLRAKARHLDAAQALFCQLRSSDPQAASDWTLQEAWSVLSLAANLRKRSAFEDAIEKALYARTLFDQLSEPYGHSRCLLMFGFCSRLIGDFTSADVHLDAAYQLAHEHHYERLRAELLMQRGEVRRCEGNAATALEMLSEAAELSDAMGLVVTRAFARSALGAVAYQTHDLGLARRSFNEAERLFLDCNDVEGLALNARRRAVVERGMANAHQRTRLRVAREFVQTALERYRPLRSPAGLAATEVEQARLTMLAGGSGGATVQRLIARLDDTRQSLLLELDPWVPRLIRDFAREAEQEALHERAERLVKAGRDRISAWTKQDPARPDALPARQPHVPDVQFEMAGEPRGRRDQENELSLLV
jgi:DNA-binding MarR family transcriptional regulator